MLSPVYLDFLLQLLEKKLIRPKKRAFKIYNFAQQNILIKQKLNHYKPGSISLEFSMV